MVARILQGAGHLTQGHPSGRTWMLQNPRRGARALSGRGHGNGYSGRQFQNFC